MCDYDETRAVVHVRMTFDGVTRTEEEFGTYESHRHIGYFRPGLDRPYSDGLILTKNPGSTGLGHRVWALDLVAGAPRRWSLEYLQVNAPQSGRLPARLVTRLLLPFALYRSLPLSPFT